MKVKELLEQVPLLPEAAAFVVRETNDGLKVLSSESEFLDRDKLLECSFYGEGYQACFSEIMSLGRYNLSGCYDEPKVSSILAHHASLETLGEMLDMFSKEDLEIIFNAVQVKFEETQKEVDKSVRDAWEEYHGSD